MKNNFKAYYSSKFVKLDDSEVPQFGTEFQPDSIEEKFYKDFLEDVLLIIDSLIKDNKIKISENNIPECVCFHMIPDEWLGYFKKYVNKDIAYGKIGVLSLFEIMNDKIFIYKDNLIYFKKPEVWEYIRDDISFMSSVHITLWKKDLAVKYNRPWESKKMFF